MKQECFEESRNQDRYLKIYHLVCASDKFQENFLAYLIGNSFMIHNFSNKQKTSLIYAKNVYELLKNNLKACYLIKKNNNNNKNRFLMWYDDGVYFFSSSIVQIPADHTILYPNRFSIGHCFILIIFLCKFTIITRWKL